jgi:hypothetical protein
MVPTCEVVGDWATTHGWHVPFEQVPGAHPWPQAPQLFVSLRTLVQVLPQRLGDPEGHWHTPFMHCSPPEHTVPQAPQLLLSDWTLVHAVPQ